MKKKSLVKKKTEIAVPSGSPAEMILHAVDGGADLEKLEKLLTLQERWNANEAKKFYNADMVLAQSKMPEIVKKLKNSQTNSKYAGLDEIITKTKEIYTAYGFSMSFNEGVTARLDHIRICANVLHKLGHKESYSYDVPLDGVGIKGSTFMTKIHAKASSISYGRRYLMCMIWNISTGDDNDGNNGSKKTVFTVSDSGKVKKKVVEAEVVEEKEKVL